MKQNVAKIIGVITIFSLSSCTTMNAQFDCPNQAGVSCQSLDQINRRVDNGEIKGRMSSATGTLYAMPRQEEFSSAEFLSKKSNLQIPLRSRERIQRVWIAPYEDSEGNYHEASVLYEVVQGSHWMSALPA